MLSKRKINNIFFFFLSTIPLSIIFGSSISLINVVLVSVFTLVILIYQKDFNFIDNISIKLIIVLYLYLIFNSLISQDFFVGASRNFGFARFIFLFICINYLFFKHSRAEDIFYFWIATIIILTLDAYIEFFLGKNIFGWGGINEPHGSRIVSFFKDEPIVGAYLSGFILMTFGFLLQKYKYKNFLPWIFLLFTFSAVLISGERSNAIKIFFGLILMFLFFDFLNLRKKIIILILTFLFLSLALNQSNYLKTRYFSQFLIHFTSKEKFEKFIHESDYFKLYRSGIAVYKNYPIFGVGNKNYRVETCSNEKKINRYNYFCLTHPHQIYIEFLAEHGIVGTLILISIFFALMFKILLNIFNSKNYIQIGSFCFIIFVFTPLLPSGAFFNDFNSTILWLNISIMFASCKKTNIFNYN